MRIWTMLVSALAGLMGASGVGLAAAAAHISGAATLATAANFLLFHAAALLALTLGMRETYHRGLLAAALLIGIGSILFCGDLALRALTGIKLFPMAAPAGGMMLIAGWLICAVAAPYSLKSTK